jgi:predicted nucleic acid-binding Zn ribbon protein
MKQCPNCGAQIADDSRFCAECGKEIPQGTVCPYCGASISEDDAFCQNCGKKLTDIEGTTYESEVVKKSGFKKYLPYIIGAFVALAVIGYFNSKDSNDSAPNDKEIQATDSVAEIVETETSDSGTEEDIKNALESMYKEILNPSKTVYNNDAKYTSSEYQSILNKAYDVAVDEVVLDADHWIQGQDCDKPSMSVVSVKKESDTKAIAEIKIKQFYNEAYQSRVRLALLFENGKWVVDDFISFGDGGEEYSEKAYLKKYIEDCQSKIDSSSGNDYSSNSSNTSSYSKYVGRWILRKTTDGGNRMRIEVTLKDNKSGENVVFAEHGTHDEVLVYEEYQQCILNDGIIYMTKDGDINGKGVPKLRVGSDGLYSFSGEKYTKKSE